jgi:hypothetical protein
MESKNVGIPNATKILPRFLKIPEMIISIRVKVLEKEKNKTAHQNPNIPAATTTNYNNYNNDSNNNNSNNTFCVRKRYTSICPY